MQEKDLGKDKLSFDEFCSKVEEEIKKRLGEETRIIVHEINKNNNLKLRGLNILKKGCNISPAFYLDFYYEEYKDGKSLSEIVNTIIHASSENGLSGYVDVSFFEDWELAKNRILFKLVSYERNRELLSQIPHKRFLDLAIVYYVPFEEFENGYASILIYNTHMEMWGKSTDDLYKEAMKNTPAYRPYIIMDVTSMMEGMISKEEAEKEKGSMYVLTNTDTFFGAATILYPDAVKNFAEKMGKDLFILPSSVHEFLIFSDDGRNPEIFSWMVNEVNREEVTQEEYLSDSVYKFSRETGEISIVLGGGIYE